MYSGVPTSIIAFQLFNVVSIFLVPTCWSHLVCLKQSFFSLMGFYLVAFLTVIR